ncbi:hypothetical protein K440DRAFT_613469 [Wilcoxina mikolae CBS 423.85]|nr:hypothetical protein K440DRAFT_613469 [Wilcoxina mikolae CBS 423.85]
MRDPYAFVTHTPLKLPPASQPIMTPPPPYFRIISISACSYRFLDGVERIIMPRAEETP